MFPLLFNLYFKTIIKPKEVELKKTIKKLSY